MPTLEDLRTAGEGELQRILTDADQQVKDILRVALRQYGSVAKIPQEVWDNVERYYADNDRLAAAIILLMVSADDLTVSDLAGQGVSRTTRQMSLGDYSRTAAANVAGLSGTVDTIRKRLSRAEQDSRLTGPGDVGEITEAGIDETLEVVFTDERTKTISIDQTTGALTTGQRGGAERTLGGDGTAETTGGVPMTVELLWRTERDNLVCPRCLPLEGQPEEIWSLVFPDGPGVDAHPNCRCYLEVRAVPAGLSESVLREGERWITINGNHVQVDDDGTVTSDGPLKGTKLGGKKSAGKQSPAKSEKPAGKPTEKVAAGKPARSSNDIKKDLEKSRADMQTAKGFAAQNKVRARIQALNAELKASQGDGARADYNRFRNVIDDETPSVYSDTSDGKASAAFHNSIFGQWSKSLSDNDKNAIATYTGGAFSTINGGLRGTEKLDSESQQTIKGLDAAFANAPKLPSDVVVHRGGGASILGDNPSALIGKVISDKGYTSTTTLAGVANGFSGTGEGRKPVVRFDIKVPKGMIAISADAALGSESLGQHELILPRGTSYKITGIKTQQLKNGITAYFVQAEVVAKGSK